LVREVSPRGAPSNLGVREEPKSQIGGPGHHFGEDAKRTRREEIEHSNGTKIKANFNNRQGTAVGKKEKLPGPFKGRSGPVKGKACGRRRESESGKRLHLKSRT